MSTISAFVQPNQKGPAGLANLLNVIALGLEKRRPWETVIPGTGNLYRRMNMACTWPESVQGRIHHLAQCSNAIFQRGMRAEQRGERAPAEHRLNDAQ